MLNVGGLELDEDVLLEPARSLVADGRREQLIDELGRNYDKYHAVLVELWAGRPARADFASADGFERAILRAERVVRAEAILRKAVTAITQGRPLDVALDSRLLSRDDKLLGLDPGSTGAA